MLDFLLTRIRLTYYFVFFLCFFVVVSFIVPRQEFNGSVLTLFSVNSFLYGFYIAPILAAQKARIEELHKIIRNEANALFDMALFVKKLPDKLRNDLQEMMADYMRVSLVEQRVAHGEEKYEELITFCIKYKGKEEEKVSKFLDKLVANQQNRTLFAMQYQNGVYSNEWIIMLILFVITLGFVMTIDAGDGLLIRLVAAFLCTGLSMLLVVLAKLSTLTHKKARLMWAPLQKMLDTRFYRFD